MLGVACSSFSETGDAPAPDAATTDAYVAEATAPEASSDDAMAEAAAPSFCAIAQADAGGHVFCADFEDGLTTAWRPLKDVAAWAVEHPEDLSLVDGTVPGQPGTKYLQALTGTEPDAAVNAQSGGLVFASPVKGGFHIEFDMNADVISDGGVTAFDVLLTPTPDAGMARTRLYLTLNATGAALVVATDNQAPLTYKLSPGFPTLVGVWRHIVLEVGGTAGAVRMTDDGFPVVNTLLSSSVILPASAKLRIGAPYYVTGPVTMWWDNVTLDALP
jgi:hypothetical protein